jgi:glutaredoxin
MFVTEQCGQACVDMRKRLAKRVDFEEFDAFDQAEGSALYKEYGGTGYLPYIVMGKQRIVGQSPGGIISAIAAEFGPAEVRESEQRALTRNFDNSGEPRVVMYATAWCGYCKKARKYFRENRIAFVEYDIEKDSAARRDYNALLGSGTPLLFQGYARVSGFDVRRIEQEFDL